MKYEQFAEINFRPAALNTIKTANAIIADYTRQGYTLTLRQLYYQFVSRGLIENSDRSYKALGNTITDGRMTGMIAWDGIEDRGRSMQRWLIQEDVDAILDALPSEYATNMWASQDTYVEVWVEKEALSSVVSRACGEYRVPYMACKGYLSASEAWRAGKRFERACARGKNPVIIHLGDHDPSGIDMTRDNQNRISTFAREEVQIIRVALNMDQVDQYDPPPNPAKITDSRAEDYIARYGVTSWELDALEPSVIVRLIEDAIRPLVDEGIWEADLAHEQEQKEILRRVRPNWPAIKRMITRNSDND